MAMKQQPTFLQLSHRLVPPAIDLATLTAMFTLVPWLGAQIFAQSSVNHYFLIPGFFLIVIGIVAIRNLPNYSIDESKDPSLVGSCLVFFLMVVYLLLYVYATNLGGSKQENDGIAVVMFFAFLLPVIGAFLWPTTNAQPGSVKALIAESIALFSVNYLTLIGASVWHHFSSLPTTENPVYATGFAFLILYGILYLIFLVFFGLPRIFLLRATGDMLGLTAYLVGVAIFLWDKVPPVH